MKDDTLQLTPVVRQPGEGPRHDILGTTHLYKGLAAETGGVSVFEETVPPGAGAPPHTHSRDDEAFYVVEGEMTFEIEGRHLPLRLGAGSFVFAPRGSRHAFRNETDASARMLVMALPGAGLERMFGAFDEAVRRAGGMPPLDEIVAIAAGNGVTVEPPAQPAA
ncbi:cupin domain-containing protein [Reyranella sp.]|jgi:quercetin dioxygenase-like cupin family protein|uniref:cupin domain-containing protein n=1 Tax=Reyranella sp. TaxID=1929291 RepID=UPI002F946895